MKNLLKFPTLIFFLILLSTFLVIFFVQQKTLLFFVIIFGQAHFIIAYFYRNKAGKIDGSYLKMFSYVSVIVGLLAFFVYKNVYFFPYWIFFTLIIFVTHYILDEFKLNEGEVILNNRILAVGAAVFSFTALFIKKIFDISNININFLLFSASLLLLISFLATNKKSIFKFTKELNITLFFLLLNIVTPFTLLLFSKVTIIHISAFIILYHYIRWYVYYYQKFELSDNCQELYFYLDTVMWIHAFVFMLYVQYSISPNAGVLHYIFTPLFFYGWTIIHIIMSVRRSDYFLINKI